MPNLPKQVDFDIDNFLSINDSSKFKSERLLSDVRRLVQYYNSGRGVADVSTIDELVGEVIEFIYSHAKGLPTERTRVFSYVASLSRSIVLKNCSRQPTEPFEEAYEGSISDGDYIYKDFYEFICQSFNDYSFSRFIPLDITPLKNPEAIPVLLTKFNYRCMMLRALYNYLKERS